MLRPCPGVQCNDIRVPYETKEGDVALLIPHHYKVNVGNGVWLENCDETEICQLVPLPAVLMEEIGRNADR